MSSPRPDSLLHARAHLTHSLSCSYRLTDSRSQITSYVFDVVRATVPKIALDAVFTTKEEIALGVCCEQSLLPAASCSALTAASCAQT